MITPMDYLLGRARPLSAGGNMIVVRPRHPSDSASVSRSSTIRDERKRPPSLNISTIPNRISLTDDDDNAIETLSARSIAITESKDGVEIHLPDEDTYYYYLENTHIHGIHHIFEKNPAIRFIWITVLIVFAFLAFYQIFNQFVMYSTTPISTNIVAEYPDKINLPTVAICNNNQFRLSYLTGALVQSRKPKHKLRNMADIDESNIFDKAFMNVWDMDAVDFLMKAGHFKRQMIIDCTYPDGTKCRKSHFKPIWTLTGLCWAINTDPNHPVMVTGSGPSHALSFLLNVERYERIESCHPKFRTSNLPGFKILIYNQTDVPTSALDGVNVPPGFTMDIPFRMQHRQKLPGINCVEEYEGSKDHKFEELDNIKTCKIKRYLNEIEHRCNCSMRKAFGLKPRYHLSFCNVLEYFKCVVNVLKWGSDRGFSARNCTGSCHEIDYIAWQDMNELPTNIFPKVNDFKNKTTEVVVNETDIDEEEEDSGEFGGGENLRCKENQILKDSQVNLIKAEAAKAYEHQAQYQEDILMRTKRLMAKVTQTAEKIRVLEWGWRNENFTGIYQRLVNTVGCFGNMSVRHSDAFNSLNNRSSGGERRKTRKLMLLLNNGKFLEPIMDYRTISDLKKIYDPDTVDRLLNQYSFLEEYILRLYSIYDENSYTKSLTKELELVDWILDQMKKYDNGEIDKRKLAKLMQKRSTNHFFEEDFYERWYNVIMRDIDNTIKKTLAELEEEIGELDEILMDQTGFKVGSVVVFSNTTSHHVELFSEFIKDMVECSFGEVRNASKSMAVEFKDVIHDFQKAYINLFNKELPEYLQNFEFGPKFVKENFAVVNVFFHQMNVEHWIQSRTYTIWSLFCDVGGALGLFLGASLLTIIEIIWFCCCRGFTRNKWCRKSEDSDDNSVENGTTDEISDKVKKSEKKHKNKRRITKIEEASESEVLSKLV